MTWTMSANPQIYLMLLHVTVPSYYQQLNTLIPRPSSRLRLCVLAKLPPLNYFFTISAAQTVQCISLHFSTQSDHIDIDVDVIAEELLSYANDRARGRHRHRFNLKRIHSRRPYGSVFVLILIVRFQPLHRVPLTLLIMTAVPLGIGSYCYLSSPSRRALSHR